MTIDEIEHLLDTYTLEEVLELDGLTEADALLFLVEEEFVKLPEITPLEFE